MTTPPPQGQNPFAQQPGMPQQPSPYLNAGGPVPPPATPQRSKFKTIKNVVVGIVVVGVVVGGFIASRDDADTASVGDCMSIGNPDSATDPDLEVVECGNSKAAYKVVQKKDGASASCDRTKYAQYTQSGDGPSFTLCLEEL
ncbi:hypothetical protein [Streptomyces sp. GC420]|uniref:LppU/SCO3897 family protein n=1 Tax=Streptomyces sp. GC420 TaxID=2697568 RepID=UPI001414D037|nr:hypothetical protein [Streptomyces sp. GC420]NBM19354.1 hypothetical protein [Streptomyces sp. GC420]